MAEENETRIYRTFLLSVTIAVSICLSAVFVALSMRTRHLIMEEVLAQARAHIEGIVLTRKWNSGYGGVYVEKKPGVSSNPYLKNPDISSASGRTYTLRNPAIMTREISEISEKEGLFSFHMSSLNPTNPANSPEEFEKEALLSFGRGKEEASSIVRQDGRTLFRYMAPLRLDEDCLKCHQREGDRPGSVRGGISVTLDISDVNGKLRNNLLSIGFFGLTTTALLVAFVYYFTSRLVDKIAYTRKTIEKVAITDPLTGLFNRRHLMSRFDEEMNRARRLDKDLGCIMLDIDLFKAVNDTKGHLHGDKVIIKIAELIKGSIRLYDIAGRFGGEEFLVVMPDADIRDTKRIAERIRQNVKEDGFLRSDGVTVSLGAVCLGRKDETTDDVLRRADEALYKAKKEGRDRVETI